MRRDRVAQSILKSLYDAQDEFGSPCEGKPEVYAGESEPAVEDTECSKCPLEVFLKCKHYRDYAKPTDGWWAGEWRGDDSDEG